MKKISIIGSGYVGLVSGAGLSEFGNYVTCVDIDKTKEQSKTRSSAPMEALDREDDRQLFEALRTHRLDIAKSENIPPYVIFHDRTLIEMAIARPDTLTAMSYIGGVGKSKLRKYGDEFLEIINDYS